MSTLLPAVRAVRWAIDAPYLRAIVAIARAGRGPDGGIAEAAARRDARAQRRAAAGVASPEALPGTYSVTLHGDCAIIPIDGPIFRRANLFTELSGGTSTEYLTHDIQAALAADRVRSLLLLVDSPGGEAKGIHELAQQIFAARDQKPIHAYTDGDCCSGAYWLAAATQQITLDASALIGSVGVVLTVEDPQHELNDDGTIEIVSSMSDLKRPDPHSQDGRATLQALVDDLGWLFVDRVATYRGLSRDTITTVRGGVLVGQRAVDAHFADALGSFASALTACQQAGHQHTRGGPLAHTPTTPIVMEDDTMPPTPENTTLLAAALGVDDSAEGRLNARINELEARITAQQATITAQQETIAALTADMRERASEQKALDTRLAQLEGDAPTVAGGFRASAVAPRETDPDLLARAPAGHDPLDDFLGG